jgi:hypothetical protein
MCQLTDGEVWKDYGEEERELDRLLSGFEDLSEEEEGLSRVLPEWTPLCSEECVTVLEESSNQLLQFHNQPLTVLGVQLCHIDLLPPPIPQTSLQVITDSLSFTF